MANQEISPGNRPQEPRTVDTRKGFFNISVSLTNRVHDYRRLSPFTEEEEMNLASNLEDLVNSAICDEGLLVFDVTNGGLDSSVTGILREKDQIVLLSTSRFTQPNSECKEPYTEIQYKNPVVKVTTNESRVEIVFSEGRSKKKDFSLLTPLFPVSGQRFQLIRSGIEDQEILFDTRKLITNFAKDAEVLVASGITRPPHTYTKPSGWYIKE